MLNENIIQKNMETEYDNSGRVENSSQLLADIITDAADYRHEVASSIDFGQSYGSKERNKLDLFWPGNDKPDKSAPIIMFIHGGYWQRLDRSAFSHMAKGLNARGVAVAIPSYTLCPDITISGIIDEIRRACIVLWKTYDCKITVCGHSAGGHLAACMLATNWNKVHQSLPDDLVPAALSISGVFDLAPLIETSHNGALKITPEEARTASPYNWIVDQGLRFDAWVGGDESSEFIRQSRSQAQRWRMMGANARYQEIAGANHFTAIAPLTDPNSFMVNRLLELLKPTKEQTLEDLNIPIHKPRPMDERPIAESSDEATEIEATKSEAPKEDAPQPDMEAVTQSPEETQENTNADAAETVEVVVDTADTAKTGGQDANPTEIEMVQTERQQDEPSPEATDTGAGTSADETDPEPLPKIKLSEPPHPTPEPVSDEDISAEVRQEPEAAETSKSVTTSLENSDDLTIISGIGKTLQARLHNLGFSTFEQLAELSETDKDMIEDALDFKGRIERDNWITQARHQKAIKELASD